MFETNSNLTTGNQSIKEVGAKLISIYLEMSKIKNLGNEKKRRSPSMDPVYSYRIVLHVIISGLVQRLATSKNSQFIIYSLFL